MISPFVFATCPSIVCRAGASAELALLTAGRLGNKVLLVTDAGLRKLGLVDGAIASLKAIAEIEVFDAVEPDPSLATVLAATTQAINLGATGIVGFGGGSSIDVAKVVALLAGSGEPIDEAWGVGNAKGPRLPLAVVPTTAGTGSEVTPVAIITVGEDEKRGVSSPILLPDFAVLDPTLTTGLPAAITAATGVDAMVHAIEAYTSANANNNPVSRTLAREALRLLGANIERAVFQGNDLEVRAAMLLGSMLAGQAFANSPVAAVHALAYPIGGMFHVPHGLSNALVLTHVMHFNAPAAAQGYAEIAPDIFPELVNIVSLTERCDALISAIEALTKKLGLQTRLRDVGVTEDYLPRLAASAMKQQRLLVNNPRPVTEQDALDIYRAAF